MSFKKFSIIASAIASFVLIVVIICGCLRVNNGLHLNDPDKILVYSKSTVAKEYSKDDTPKKYGELNNLYKNMTNLNLFDYMISKNDIFTKPTQDISNNNGSWNNINKQNGYCLEFIYNKSQTIVVSVDGDTKVIEFFGLIMQVEENKGVKNIAMYFSTSTGSSKTYTDSPIVVIGNQNRLFNYINAME